MAKGNEEERQARAVVASSPTPVPSKTKNTGGGPAMGTLCELLVPAHHFSLLKARLLVTDARLPNKSLLALSS